MPRSKYKKGTAARPLKTATAKPPLPAQDSITGVEEFRKGKKVFRIIHTNEVDEYERTPSEAKRKKR